MKHYLIIIFFAMTSCPVLAQSEEWVRHVAGDEDLKLWSITSFDNSVYVTGYFAENGCFLDSQQSNCFSDLFANEDYGQNRKGFLLSLEKDGSLNWAVLMPVRLSSTENFFDVEVDSLGNIYVASAFRDTADIIFQNGNIYELESNSSSNAFLIKIDPTGNLIWLNQIVGVGNGGVNSVKIDISNENVIVTGNHVGNIDLNPQGSSFVTGNGNVFIASYTVNGEFNWGYSIDGLIIVRDIHNDINSNVLITGEFENTVNFNPYGTPSVLTTTNIENRDAFLLKINEDGNFVWVKKTLSLKNVSPNPWHPQIHSFSVSTDSEGNIFNAGVYTDSVIIFPNQNSIIKPSTKEKSSGFILKVDPYGDLIWSHNLGGNSPNEDSSIVVFNKVIINNQNEILIGGFFYRLINFDPESEELYQTEYDNNYEGFVLKMDANRTFNWVQIYKSENSTAWDTRCHDLIYTNSGNIVSVGWFKDSVSFPFNDKTPSTLNSWNNNKNGFIHKFQDSDYEEEVVPEPEFNLNIFPNPTTNYVEIHFGKPVENVSIKITDMRGKKVLEKYYTEAANFIYLDLYELSTGVYVIKTTVEQNIYMNKLIKQA